MAITALDKLINGNDLVKYTDLLKSGLPFASIDQYKGHEYALSNFGTAATELIKKYNIIYVPSGSYDLGSSAIKQYDSFYKKTPIVFIFQDNATLTIKNTNALYDAIEREVYFVNSKIDASNADLLAEKATSKYKQYNFIDSEINFKNIVNGVFNCVINSKIVANNSLIMKVLPYSKLIGNSFHSKSTSGNITNIGDPNTINSQYVLTINNNVFKNTVLTFKCESSSDFITRYASIAFNAFDSQKPLKFDAERIDYFMNYYIVGNYGLDTIQDIEYLDGTPFDEHIFLKFGATQKYVDDIASKKANFAEVTTSIKTAIDNLRSELMGEGVPEAYDTFKELADYIERHQTVADALVAAVGNKVDKIEGKGLSTNDYTTEDKNKLDGIEAGAQVNTIESISVNGTNQTPSNKNIDITVPTGELANKSEISESDLDIDLKNKLSGYAKKTDLDSYLPKSGGTMTGPLTVDGKEDNIFYAMKVAKDRFIAGIQNNNTKNAGIFQISGTTISMSVVDDNITNFLNLTPSGVFTESNIDITHDKQLTHKLYVDNAVSAVKPKAHKVTLTVAGWDSTAKTQTVNVTDVLADETKQLILPMPTSASMSAYTEAGIMCTGQAAGKLTFTADTVPTAAIEVYVTISNVNYS